MSKVVVVGAGVGGLAAAGRLAALGHAVTVCEASQETGGKLGLYEQDGFRFDTGPSLVTMPHVFRDLFDATGGWPAGLELTPLEPLARYRFADGTRFDASSDLDVHCARLDEALGWGAGDDWRAFSERAARIWAASRGPFLESALNGPSTIARLALRQPRDLATIAPGLSLRALGRRYLRDPRLRTYLDRYATYTGSDPRRAPAALAAVPFVEQAYGGWYVPGGLHRLGQAVADRAVERGAQVRLGARVARIELTGRRVSGVRLVDGEQLPADLVVTDVDAAVVYRMLVEAPGPARRLARATPSLAGFVLLLGVRGATPGLAHHNVLFPVDYDAEFDGVFGDTAQPVSDPTLYVSAPDDPTVHPPGCEAWFVLVNAPRHSAQPGPGAVDWRAPGLADAYAERLLDLLAARGLPVRDRILFSRVLSPADLEGPHGCGRRRHLRDVEQRCGRSLCGPPTAPVRGLFLVGGSAHPGGGLPLVTLSAQIVAGLIGPAQ